MKFSEKWLREWVNPILTTDELVAQLSMAGLEVDSCEPVAEDFSEVYIGEVLTVDAHPSADKLRVCVVNAGQEKPLTIVCGAPNVEAGMKVPTAIIGAQLPNGIKISKTIIRGVESDGMLCSGKELSINDDDSGLMRLPAECIPGMTVREYLNLDDVMIELDLTPNRGDCLSLVGIAREVGVLNQCQVEYPEIKKIEPTINDIFPIEVKATEDCPRYVGRVIRGINVNAQTPYWMQEKLRRSGIRSLSPVVDVTNFVLLELGQPMHAFDLDTLHEGIVVRKAHENEKIMLLDDQRVTLNTDTLVIADHANAQAMAGVMGGADTAVDTTTSNIFLESAFFAPAKISGRARSYGLHTDSSHRFERGVDPELQRKAMERATALLLEIVGGNAGPIIDIRSKEHLPTQEMILLRRDRIRRLLGINIPDDEIRDVLSRLGMIISEVENDWEVYAPSFRSDISLEVDLIEEIIRIYGYANVPSKLPQALLAMKPQPESQVSVETMRDILINRGYQEAITYSFVDPDFQSRFVREHHPAKLANPISSDMAVMRSSLLPGLVDVLSRNVKRQQHRVRLFENGLKFSLQSADYTQEKVIAGVVCGNVNQEQWAQKGQVIDFYDLKADVQALLSLSEPEGNFRYIKDVDHPAFHPGQCARIEKGEQVIGWLGVLHPSITQMLDISEKTCAFELELEPIMTGNVAKFSEISKYPSIRRDLAVVVDENISFSALEECIYNDAPETLKSLQIFDVYRGKGIDSGEKSLALGLTFQDLKRTLNDSDVDDIIAQIMSSLNNNLGAKLRS